MRNRLLEECFVTKDPFSPDKERFLVLGSNCSLCGSSACVGSVRSVSLKIMVKLGIWDFLEIVKRGHIMKTLFLGFGVLLWVSGAPTRIQTLKNVCTMNF